ncbi:MAG: DUF2341 domain-containing protein [Deltaproteobacteria bacterium]|nr:DUF2341 domain-containing protein [Deltaproteobacteria bacterium]
MKFVFAWFWIIALIFVNSCVEIKRQYNGWSCTADTDCLAGYVCDLDNSVCVSCIDHDDDHYGQGLQCLGADCDDSNPEVNLDCSSITHITKIDCSVPTCIDNDGDGVGDGTCGNSSCVIATTDSNDNDSRRCTNLDSDTCDDCNSGKWDPFKDGSDGQDCGGGVVTPTDTDNDGVDDIDDPYPNDPTRCRDVDKDTCDDCSKVRNPPDPYNDGQDSNDNGICDLATWYDTNWQYLKNITLNRAAQNTNLSNFPVLIATTDIDLANKATSRGNDIVFTTVDGKTTLNWEIERWDKSSGQLIAWVKIPTLSGSGNTIISMYYGNSNASSQQNPTGVWDINYMGVWHLANNTNTGTASILDSTANHNNGTMENAISEKRVDNAKVGYGVAFDGTNDLINVGSNPSLDNLSIYTFSGWMITDGLGTGVKQRFINKTPSGTYDYGQNQFSIFRDSDNEYLYARRYRDTSELGVISPSASVPLSQWNHVVAVFDVPNDSAEIWINGVQRGAIDSTGAGGIKDDASYDLLIGNNPGASRGFAGTLDEWRISNTARSSAWIITSFNNQNDPSSFYVFSNEEPIPN